MPVTIFIVLATDVPEIVQLVFNRELLAISSIYILVWEVAIQSKRTSNITIPF